MTTTDSPKLISNLEVHELLSSRLSRKDGQKFRHRDWIAKKVHQYLSTQTPCTKLDSARRDELKDILQAGYKKRKVAIDSSSPLGFGLTEAEALQILNFLPSEPVEIHLMIEELHTRMPEREQDRLLELIPKYQRKIVKMEGLNGNATSEVNDEDQEEIALKVEGEMI